MRAFVQLRTTLSPHKKRSEKLKELEQRLEDHDDQIQAVFEAIRQLILPPEKAKKKNQIHGQRKASELRQKNEKKDEIGQAGRIAQKVRPAEETEDCFITPNR